MKLDLTHREASAVLRRRAAKGRQRLNGPKLETRRAKPKHGRERDAGFLSWLHEDIPCIACIRLGRPAIVPNPIEAAHQKIQASDKGLHRKLGVRPSDRWCVALCAQHHRLGPTCCDPAQGKFWALVGLEPGDLADFCMELHAAYRDGLSGAAVVQRFARIAAQGRAA